MGVRGVYSQGDRSTRFRVSKNGDGGKELLGKVEGGVKLGGPQERFAQTLRIIPAFSMAENSSLAADNLSGSKRRGFG